MHLYQGLLAISPKDTQPGVYQFHHDDIIWRKREPTPSSVGWWVIFRSTLLILASKYKEHYLEEPNSD